MNHIRPHLRTLGAAAVGGALQAALLLPADWYDRAPGVPAALGILLAVAAGAAGGTAAGLAVAAVGWGLHLGLVADDTDVALLALPAWLGAAGLAGALSDLLRRRRSERRLAALRLEAVERAVAEAVVRVDGDGVVTAASPAAEDAYGWTVGTALAGAVGEDDGRRLVEALRAPEAIALEPTLERADGTRARTALVAAPTADGEAVVVARDVDEVRRLEGLLRESVTRHRSLTALLPLATYVRPAETGSAPTFVSPGFDALLGYPPDAWRSDPGLLLRLVHPDDRARVERERARLPAPGVGLRCEYRMTPRDGRPLWVREEAVLVLDAAGEPLCVQGYLLDVSERRLADDDRARLRAAEAAATAEALDRQRKSDFVAEAAALLASSLDHRTRVANVAARAVRDLADWCLVDVVEEDGSLVRLAAEHGEPRATLPEPAAEPEPAVAEAIRTGAPVVSPSLLRVPLAARGRRVVGALTLLAGEGRRPFASDDLAWAHAVAGLLALAVDNARLYDEVEARTDASRVLTYVGDGVFLLDRTGVVRLWNPAAEAITSLASDDVVGRAADEAIAGWTKIAERVPVAAAREPVRTETLPLETGLGERWISISGVEFFGGTVYAFRDITEAHQLDRLQADFIATASHELRTPLAAVYGAAQTLRRHDFALDESGRERFITLIVEESDRLGRIVNQILLANQLDVGRLDLVTEPFEGLELIERVVEAARTHAPPHISLDVLPSAHPPLVAADKDRVRQILVNLVENAIKYSPDGGRIQLGVEEIEGTALFRILDEGLGIPPDEMPRIFEKFYRLDPDMTRGIGGTGLGLYICSELVERMGGRIWVESRDGPGSAFYFELPSGEASRSAERLREAAGG